MRFFVFGLLMFICIPVHAATLYMDPNTVNLNRGDAVKVAVRLDTDEAAGECVNAVDGVITYSENIIAADVSIGKSIFPIWVEDPVINKEKRTITFAGGIPNGYCGRVQGDPNLTNTLVEIIFRSPGLQVGGGEARTQASAQFDEITTAYLNDGSGTKASLQKLGVNFTLGDNFGNEILDPWSTETSADTTPPEEFSATVEKINGEWYAVFNTTDKQTGISHYEIIEETYDDSKLFNFGAANAPWVEARSPYRLSDQTRNSVVRVKAVDKNNNEYIATVPIDESARAFTLTTDMILLGGVGSVLALIVFVLVYWYILRRRQKSTVDHDEQDSVANELT